MVLPPLARLLLARRRRRLPGSARLRLGLLPGRWCLAAPWPALGPTTSSASCRRRHLYSYVYRAGFGGVMGRECIGIIPPFIREFGYPMARNCAGGDTAVFVNGRELRQRGFDLLVGRGLPRISDKSYSIETSGNTTDETTGKKLRSLGKLAPTAMSSGAESKWTTRLTAENNSIVPSRRILCPANNGSSYTRSCQCRETLRIFNAYT